MPMIMEDVKVSIQVLQQMECVTLLMEKKPLNYGNLQRCLLLLRIYFQQAPKQIEPLEDREQCKVIHVQGSLNMYLMKNLLNQVMISHNLHYDSWKLYYLEAKILRDFLRPE